MLVNGLRGRLAEFGIIAAKGLGVVKTIIEALHKAQDQLPELARLAPHGIVEQLRHLGAEIERREDTRKNLRGAGRRVVVVHPAKREIARRVDAPGW